MNGNELVIVVRFLVRRGEEERFARRLAIQARTSLEVESGCLQFDVCRHPEDPRRILLYEVYTDADAFEAHLASDHFQAFDAETAPWIEEKSVERWTRSSVS